ncbi:hypothetical protein Anas_03685 [Armadillidium nasatum]|uniref:Uncharacterized protein n=1 Tax=Armadillidium nasatum TaxID=96803 RepID=A0A5N5SRM9_9CRUS|nr:hypothetical protein Anas_03685 [Armadillidium nasatum]
MNKEINTNQGKLPIKARIGRGKVTNHLKTAHLPNRLKTAHFKNARNKTTGGKAFQMKKSQLKITRTIEGRKGGISVTSRNLIAKDGKIVRIKRNIPLNSGKKLVKPVGRKILQTQNIRNNSRNRLGENSNTVGRKILRTQDIRKNSRNRLEQNLNPSVRKVEFDDQGGLEVEAGQGDFMGNLNYGFEAMPTFPQIQIPLLPTPPVQQRIFPPVLEPFHNNSQNLMNVNMDNLRNLEWQNAQKYEEELRALERKRVEEEIREIERKRMEEMEMKRKQEEMRKMERKREEEMREMERKRMEELMFEEEQKRFEEEQRRYEEEQRMIEEERKNLDYLRKALDMEKRELENLKKTVEEEEEMERRSVSKGREMTNKFVFGLDSNRSKQIGKLNIAQNQKSQDTRSKPSSQRDRYDSRVNNSNRKYENA